MEVAELLSNKPCTSTSTAQVVIDQSSTASFLHEESHTFSSNPITSQQNIVEGQNLPSFKINAQDTSAVTIKVYNNCTFNTKDV